ncbi:hypothetical protein NCAS_0C01640 [Naumovozyma castellii]|uniref:Uncharacterized protein n=1 Tax=Naumovozyma castellii TaxID=27288 RepID=G0VCE5_NAUCA|nr:hypothetical protein NCAS_0C01640 [Naumovozyma castellii CBS 4309]CCC69154.1 hypothetical protein NCAS_0C01640 [Naumovozyma castellii CBS 4309]
MGVADLIKKFENIAKEGDPVKASETLRSPVIREPHVKKLEVVTPKEEPIIEEAKVVDDTPTEAVEPQEESTEDSIGKEEQIPIETHAEEVVLEETEEFTSAETPIEAVTTEIREETLLPHISDDEKDEPISEENTTNDIEEPKEPENPKSPIEEKETPLDETAVGKESGVENEEDDTTKDEGISASVEEDLLEQAKTTEETKPSSDSEQLDAEPSNNHAESESKENSGSLPTNGEDKTAADSHENLNENTEDSSTDVEEENKDNENHEDNQKEEQPHASPSKNKKKNKKKKNKKKKGNH